MPDLADQVAARGVLPGIWFRPLLSRTGGSYVRPTGPAFALDPSHPAALERVVADVRRLVSWGFRLLKHDFSTYDFLGHFGAHGPLGKPRPSWRLSDPGLTNAEALLRFYRVLRDAAGDAILLGCNTVGHLAAGLVEAQRTGDDTSGRDWERTRRMGVNTLAYRLPQHGRFFTLDADCVPATPQTPWSRNREFLDLVARSGTALFVSVDPSARTPAVDRDLREAFKIALDGGEPGGVRPLDWQESPASRRWAVGETTRSYDWTEPWGASPIPM
jgi:alpha-galactosidase